MMNARRTRGFTLVELILVIAILGVLTTMGVVMFGRINHEWTVVKNRTELDATAEYAFGQIRQDLAAFVSPSLTGAPLQGADATSTGAAFPGQQLASDSLVIPLRGTSPEGDDVLAAAKYDVQVLGGTRTLTRSRAGLYGEEVPGEPVTVAPGVVHFNVQFLDAEGNWQDSWDSASPPSAVRVSLVVANPDRPERQVARETQFAVRVS